MSSMIVHPTVPSAIVPKDIGTVVEEVAAAIIIIDREEPTRRTPNDWAQEIICSQQEFILPVVQDILQVGNAITHVFSIDVGFTLQTEQIVQVDLERIIVLLFVQVELIGHLVRQVVSLFASLLIIHSFCAEH